MVDEEVLDTVPLDVTEPLDTDEDGWTLPELLEPLLLVELEVVALLVEEVEAFDVPTEVEVEVDAFDEDDEAFVVEVDVAFDVEDDVLAFDVDVEVPTFEVEVLAFGVDVEEAFDVLLDDDDLLDDAETLVDVEDTTLELTVVLDVRVDEVVLVEYGGRETTPLKS